MDPAAALAAAWLAAVSRVELSPDASPSGPPKTLTDVIEGALRDGGLGAELSRPKPNDPGHVVNRLV